MISDEDDLEADLIKFLRKNTADGGWFSATYLGLEMGFDCFNAASRIRGLLIRLVKRGVVEIDKSIKPAIYRIKQQPK